jgi:serine protease
MPFPIRALWLSSTALFLSFAMTACMASSTTPDSAPDANPQVNSEVNPSPRKAPAQVGEPVGGGPFAQFIVKYRDDSAPLKQQGVVQTRLNQTAQRLQGVAGKGGAPTLTWKHRMGINADVFSVSPALDRAGAQRLMQAFAADPDVQFIEPDNHIALDPIIRGPEVIEK